MKVILLSLFLFLIIPNIRAQDELAKIDSILNLTASKKTGHLKRIKLGTRRTGTAFFYLKSSEKVFSIVDRKSYYNSNKKRDSSSEYKYFYLNDKLVKVIYYRSKERPNSNGYAYLYFKDNNLLGHKEYKDYPTSDLEFVLHEAILLLNKANNLFNKN